MKKRFIVLTMLFLAATSAFAGTKLILTPKLTEDKQPTERLTEITLNPEQQIYAYIYQDDNTTFNVEKVFIEIFRYDKYDQKYKSDNLLTVRTQKNWGYCYMGIYFKQENKYKIRVFTQNGELAVREIEVVKK
jgi:hypothetical protein